MTVKELRDILKDVPDYYTVEVVQEALRNPVPATKVLHDVKLVQIGDED
jgi:hypothetical protein